jgi:hypothetical protein
MPYYEEVPVIWKGYIVDCYTHTSRCRRRKGWLYHRVTGGTGAPREWIDGLLSAVAPCEPPKHYDWFYDARGLKCSHLGARFDPPAGCRVFFYRYSKAKKWGDPRLTGDAALNLAFAMRWHLWTMRDINAITGV